jgi:biotin synthase
MGSSLHRIRLLDLERLTDSIVAGDEMEKQEAFSLTRLSGHSLFYLLASANRIRERFRGRVANLCTIINAKSGGCGEDCAFCAQSSSAEVHSQTYPLLKKEQLIKAADAARRAGAGRFSVVTSGRRSSKKDMNTIAEVFSDVRKEGFLPCASLGMLKRNDFTLLKKSGLDRYHHNLETSERFFPNICRTHTYADRIDTIRAAQAAGLSVCSGGIFGMGESWEDRIEIAYALRESNVESVAINFLVPIKGTRMEKRKPLPPREALHIISLFRHILPKKEIRICGGRLQVLGELHAMIFLAGADGLITGNYLTTAGRDAGKDLEMIRAYGLKC